MDSIYKGMPIGAFLIWDTPKSKKLYLRQQYNVLPPFNDKNKQVWFLIDGQQRMSVLHGIHRGKSIPNSKGKIINFKNVVFCLTAKKNNIRFRYRKPQHGLYISVSDILLPYFNSQFKGLNKSNLEVLKKCRSRILDYKMLLMFTRMTSIEEVRECFLRINTQGMKVSSADAIFTKAQTLDLRDFVYEVKQSLSDSYKKIDGMPILWTLNAIRGDTYPGKNSVESGIDKIEKEATKNASEKKNILKQWSLLKVCFKKAIIYLEINFKVLSLKYLYSPYMISMLALFYYHNNKNAPDQKQKKQIRRWFWSTTTASRYSGKNFYKSIIGDVKFFEKLARNNNTKFISSEYADIHDIRKTQYDSTSSGMGSAFYCLLFKKKPVSLLDNSINEIPLERYLSPISKDRHHIFPKAKLKHIGVHYSTYNSICNVCLLTSAENKIIGKKHPVKYLKEAIKNKNLFKNKMIHHLIPYNNDNWLWNKNIKNGFRQFIQERQNMIKQSLEKEAGIRLFRDFI